MTISTRRNRIPPIWIGVIAIACTLIFAPIITAMLANGNDYPKHIYWARMWNAYGFVDAPLPHFLYQFLLNVAQRILADYGLAAAVLGLVCYLSTALILFREFFRSTSGAIRYRGVLAAGATLILLLVGTINLSGSNLYFGSIVTNAHHNPTIVLLKPFALLTFLYGLKALDGSRSSSRIELLLCAFMSLLGTMAKPNYTISFIPAFGLLALWSIVRRQSLNWPLTIIGLAVPMTLTLLWQINYMRGTELGGFAFQPLLVMNAYSPDGQLFIKFIASIAFPLGVVVFYWQSIIRSPMMWLAWISFAFGAFYTYFMVETRSPLDGNFLWSGQISLFVLFAASLVFLAQQWAVGSRKFILRVLVCLILLGLHLLSGLALYAAYLSPDWRNWL